jgi:hypothetical protein
LKDVVLPPVLPSGTPLSASSAWNGVSINYAEEPRARTLLAAPIEAVVALLQNGDAESLAVAFVRRETLSPKAHPQRENLLRGIATFASTSPDLRAWRENLITRMRTSLDTFKRESGNPTRLEAVLGDGYNAVAVYRLLAGDNRQDALQDELVAEHRKLRERVAIASAFRKVSLNDPFLGVRRTKPRRRPPCL